MCLFFRLNCPERKKSEVMTLYYPVDPLSMGFSRQEYWSGLPFPLTGDLPNPGMEPRSPELQANSLWSEPLGKPVVNVLLLSFYS